MAAEKIKIVFIVNGEDVEVETNVHPRLIEAVARALQQSGNTGRPPEDWEVRDAKGALLDTNRRIEDFNFPSGVRLFLTLRVGAGGAS